MKIILSKSHFFLITEQTIWSSFNFFIAIFVFRNLDLRVAAAVGVNLVAMYGIISILRNFVSGIFLNKGFSTTDFALHLILNNVIKKCLKCSPLIFILMIASSVVTNISYQNAIYLVFIAVFFLFVDNIRQVYIAYHNFGFLIFQSLLSVGASLVISFSFLRNSYLPLSIWSLTYSFFTFFTIIYLSLKKTLFGQEIDIYIKEGFQSLVVESFFNHSLFYLFNLILLLIDPDFCGEIRIYTIWIVSAASTLYATLNTEFTLKLVNRLSTKSEQRWLNLFCIAVLLLFSCLYFFSGDGGIVPDEPKHVFNLLGVVASSASYFIHSRIAVLYYHYMTNVRLVVSRFTTWILLLGNILFFTFVAGSFGFLFSAIGSLFFSFYLYESALTNSKLVDGAAP